MSGEALCLSCGLCCDGSLFALVAIDPTEARVLRDAGVAVLDEGGRLKLPQRCGALDGCRCRVYPGRPAGCRRFTCLLLHALEHGELGLEEAKAEVETTRAMLARLEGLLPKAAPGDRSGPVLRAATIHRQGGRISDAASAAWDEADEQLRRRFVSR
jgi:Fe-S-cluster containining protein